MHKKVLTVSIAAYNIERFINETVGSLLLNEDDMEKLDIIIVNDGSKDGTSKLAHELEKKYPDSIVVIDKLNGGYGSTINASLDLAKGKYYKLLDGDDWFNTDQMKEFLQFLEKSDADLVVTPYYEVRNTHILIDNHTRIPEQTVSVEGIEGDRRLFAMHEIAIKTELLKKQGYKIAHNCFYTDSEYVFYCMLTADTVARFTHPIYMYRLGVEGQSVSLEGIRKHQGDLQVVADRILATFTDEIQRNRFEGWKKEIVEFCVQNITYQAYRSFMLLEQPNKKRNELINMDSSIRKMYPDAFIIGNRSKLVYLSRRVHFHGYCILCYYAKKQYIKELNETN